MTTADHAQTPTRLGDMTLPNRFVVAPMTRVSATVDGVPTGQMGDYYADFAIGGFGLIITEGTYTDTEYAQGYFNQPGLATAAQATGWRAVTDRVHDSGARILVQLMHAGALSQGNAHQDRTLGPSAIQPLSTMMSAYGGSGPWPIPKAATHTDLDTVIAGFVGSTRNAMAAGFDGVEIHGANGYLLDQFLTNYTNTRTDSYGNSLANRLRLTVQIAEAVTATALTDFTVGLRLSQNKVNDSAYRWPGGEDDARYIFEALHRTGIHYLHIASEGRDWLQSARFASGRTITSLAREISGLPVIANGGMHDSALANHVLSQGHADLLAIGHGALMNPDLPHRLAHGAALQDFDKAMLEPDVSLQNAQDWRDRHPGGRA